MGKIKLIWDALVKYKTFIITTMAVILTVIMFQTCEDNRDLRKKIKEEKLKTDQNIAALTEDLKSYKDKYDNKGFIKPILQLTKDELKEYNPSLYAELEKELAKVVIVYKPKIVYVDSGKTKNTVVKLADNKYSLNFNYTSKDNVLDIAGRSTFGASVNRTSDSTKFDLNITPGITYLDSTSIKFGLVTGIRQDPDNIYRIFVKPSSPNIKITSLEGAVVSDYINLTPVAPEPVNKFGISAYIGWGATIDSKTRNAAMGPSAGVGVTYQIFSFGKKK